MYLAISYMHIFISISFECHCVPSDYSTRRSFYVEGVRQNTGGREAELGFSNLVSYAVSKPHIPLPSGDP